MTKGTGGSSSYGDHWGSLFTDPQTGSHYRKDSSSRSSIIIHHQQQTAAATPTTARAKTPAKMSRNNQNQNRKRGDGGCLSSSLNQLSSLWRPLVSEALGTGLLVLVALSSVGSPAHPSELHHAVGAGLTVAILVESLFPVSGAHINPAVTAGMLAIGRIPWPRAALYVVAQVAGGSCGAGLLRYLSPLSVDAGGGVTQLSSEVSPLRALGIEWALAAILLTVVLCVVDRRPECGVGLPLSIAVGMTVLVCSLWGMKYTGASMNPARSFGPALVFGNWKHHWVYWLGPVSGGVSGALLYKYVLMTASACTDCDTEPLSPDDQTEEHHHQTDEIVVKKTDADVEQPPPPPPDSKC